MRLFTDPATGTRYDVSVGRESYGMQVVLFFPQGGGDVLKAMLAAETRLDAQAELDAFSDEDLRECLDRAIPWEASSFSG